MRHSKKTKKERRRRRNKNCWLADFASANAFKNMVSLQPTNFDQLTCAAPSASRKKIKNKNVGYHAVPALMKIETSRAASIHTTNTLCIVSITGFFLEKHVRSSFINFNFLCKRCYISPSDICHTRMARDEWTLFFCINKSVSLWKGQDNSEDNSQLHLSNFNRRHCWRKENLQTEPNLYIP